MEDYATLLKRGAKQVKKTDGKEGRFKLPKVLGRVQGNKTFITNWRQIASDFNRDEQQLTKIVLRELGAPGELKNQTLMIGTKISSTFLNKKLEEYAKEFVICPQCNRPDTKIAEKNNLSFLVCLSCGARTTLRR